MTYNEIIQKAGKRIKKHVYYIKNNTTTYVSDDNIERIKINTQTPLVGTSIKGCEITLKEKIDGAIYVQIDATYETETKTKTYGPFNLKEEPTYDASKKTYLHKCYDNLLTSMVDYQAITINYPCTIYQFFTQLIAELGYTTSISSLINGTIQITSDPYDGIGYTYRDVLDDIAYAAASCFYIDNSQIKLAYNNMGGAPIQINDDILKKQNISFGEYYGPINSIVLTRSADTDSVYLKDDTSIAQYGLCEFRIKNNQLMNGNNRSDFLSAILNRLKGIGRYYIYDVELVGYGETTPQRDISFTTNNNTYFSHVFNEEITLTSGYKQALYTDIPEQTESDYKYMTETDRRINQTYLIVDKQNQTIESVVSQTVDTSNPDSTVNKVSRLTQRVDSLESEISNVTGMVMTKESPSASVRFDDSTNESEPVNIKVHPIGTNISYLYPRSNLYPSSGLYSTTRKIRFTNTTTSTFVDYELPDDLLYYDSEHYDEFYLDLNSQTCQVTKKCKYNADGTVGLLTSGQVNSYTYPLIQLTEGIYTVSILGYNTGYISATLMAKNIYTDQFYTKVETDSKISQSADNINLSVNQRLSNYSTTNEMNAAINIKANEINQTVSQKVGNNEIISKINQTPETITINASKLNLQGYVTASDLSGTGTTTINGSNIMTGEIKSSNYVSGTSGTKINLSDGTIDTKNFKVSNTGNITAKGGTIGGWNVNGNTGLASGNSSIAANGELSLYPTTGGVYRFAAGGVRINADLGAAIASSSNGNVYAVDGNLDLKACTGHVAYLACVSGADGTGEKSAVSCQDGILYLRSTGTIYANGSPIGGSSSRATKENIKDLTELQKQELIDLISNIPLKQFDYKKEYGKPYNYGFIIEDIENTKLGTLLHITQNEINKDIKTYSTEDLARLELIVIQELIKENKRLEERISRLEKKESDK